MQQIDAPADISEREHAQVCLVRGRAAAAASRWFVTGSADAADNSPYHPGRR
jgi:hypothetical protein